MVGGQARWRIALCVVLPAVVAGSGACSDGGAATVDPVATTTTVDGEEQRRLELDAAVVAGGFEVAVTGVRLVSSAGGRTVAVVDTEVTNRSSSPGSLTTVPATLRHEGLDPVRLFRPDLPTIDAGRSAPVELPFLLPEQGFAVETSHLVLGADGQNQARVALDGSHVNPLHPRAVPVEGEIVAGHLRLAVSGAEVRYDDPLAHEMLPAGQALVTLRFDARRAADGSPNLTGENLRLQLPGGAMVGTRDDGRSSPNVVLEKAATVEGLTARFSVPFAEVGTFHLVVAGPYGDGSTDVQAALGFDLDPAPAAT